MKRTLQVLGATLACVVASTLVQGSIRSLTLDQMMANVDNAVVGQIVDRHVFRADHPVDGTMYFTTITVDGTSLIDGQPLRVPVTYLGGWIDENEGTSTSVTPDPNTVALGKRVDRRVRLVGACRLCRQHMVEGHFEAACLLFEHGLAEFPCPIDVGVQKLECFRVIEKRNDRFVPVLVRFQ